MASRNNSGCLGVIFNLLGIGGKNTLEGTGNEFPYGIRDDFLSAAELRFYRVLVRVAPETWTILSKVRVADVLFTRQPNQNIGARNRIQMKHVDFVVCESESMNLLAAIELDDSSHDSPKGQERDRFINGAFAAAGLPLIRFRARSQYDPQEVAATISGTLNL